MMLMWHCSNNMSTTVVPHDKWSSKQNTTQSAVVSGQRDVSVWSAT